MADNEIPLPEVWCGMVAALCAPAMLKTATDAMLVMLPLLQRRFTPAVFVERSAVAIAEADRRLAIPDYGEICKVLEAYRLTFVYEAPRLAIPAPWAPQGVPPTEGEVDYVAELVASLRKPVAAINRDATEPVPRPPSAPLFTSDDVRRLDAIAAWRKQQSSGKRETRQ